MDIQTNSTINKNSNMYLAWIIFGIITVAFISLTGYIIYDLLQKKNYIHKDQCNKPIADWQVEHGIKYTDVIETKTNISNLTQAIDYCNNNDKCNRFTFNSKTNSIKIVTLTSEGIKDINNDTYTRQTGITYVNPNNTKKLYTTNNIDYVNNLVTTNINTSVTNGYLQTDNNSTNETTDTNNNVISTSSGY